MPWNNDFWTRLDGEQPSLRFDMYYRRRDDLRLPVELVAGEPRVPIDAHVLALLDRVDQDSRRRDEDWSLGKTRRGPSRPPPRWPIDCV